MTSRLPRIASFSGGRSSAVMVKHMIDSGKPPDAVVFCNTGMESHETLDFAFAVAEHIVKPAGIPFVALEFCFDEDGKRTYREVSRETAFRDGSMFYDFCVGLKQIPNPYRRACTSELKIRTTGRWVRQTLGVKSYETAAGIRADEPRRVARMRQRRASMDDDTEKGLKNRFKDSFISYPLLPLADRGIDRAAVVAEIATWGAWADVAKGDTHLSNCQGCFMSKMTEKMAVFDNRPDLAQVWKDCERSVGEIKEKQDTGRREPNTKIISFHRKAFNEDLPSDEAKIFTFNENCSWQQLERIHRQGDAIGMFSDKEHFGLGGCMEGECNTD